MNVSQERRWTQTLIVPLVNAFMPGRFVAQETQDARFSFVDVSEELIHYWKRQHGVNCAIGSLGWILERANVAVLLEARSTDNLLADPATGDDLGVLLALVASRLPYALWTPFLDQRFAWWPHSESKIQTLGFQRHPTEMEVHAITDLDEQTFQRFWSLISEHSPEGGRLRRALGRFSRAQSSVFFEDAVLNAFIGLEALFADHTVNAPRVALKVRKRAAQFICDPDLSQTAADLIGISDSIKNLYRVRHDIVHGAEVDDSQRNHVARETIQLLATALETVLSRGFGELRDLPALSAKYEVTRRLLERREKFTARGTFRS